MATLFAPMEIPLVLSSCAPTATHAEPVYRLRMGGVSDMSSQSMSTYCSVGAVRLR